MDPKRRSRTEQLHLYKPQQAKTIRQSFEYAFHLRNLTQHLRLGGFLLFQLYHRRQASGPFCRYPYGWQHLQPKDAAAMETVLPTPLCILQTLGTMDPEPEVPASTTNCLLPLWDIKTMKGQYLNKNLKYMQVFESSLGVDWHLQDRFMVSAEGFFKRYSRMPLSLQDNIPLACKGNVTVSPATSTRPYSQRQGLRTGNHVPLAGIRQVQSRILLHLIPQRILPNRSNGDFIPSASGQPFHTQHERYIQPAGAGA